MAASQLYQQLIVNSTYNVNKIKAAGGPNAFDRTPQQLGLRPEQSLKPTDARQFDQQFQLDAAMWYGAIATGPFSFVVLKLFHMFYYAGVIYKTKDSWDDWSNNRFGNVASLLSHGQRVLVQIPNTANGGAALWTWLNATDQIPQRPYATHGIVLKSTPTALIRGHRQYLHEKHGWGQSLKGHIQDRHYAFNVALGGEDNRNPFSAANDDIKQNYTPIKANGLNGHVYVNYKPPTATECGGMLVGCENAEHGRGSNPHTKAGHGLGGSQKVSACGGLKWSKLKIGPAQEYDGFVCDLTDRGANLDWLLNRALFDPNLLDGPTGTVLPVNAAPPKPGSLQAALQDGLQKQRRMAAGSDDD